MIAKRLGLLRATVNHNGLTHNGLNHNLRTFKLPCVQVAKKLGFRWLEKSDISVKDLGVSLSGLFGVRKSKECSGGETPADAKRTVE